MTAHDERTVHPTMTQLTVSPQGHYAAFVLRQSRGSAVQPEQSLWLYEFSTGECYKLLEDSQFLGAYRWEDEGHLLYLARGIGGRTWCRRYYVETLVEDEVCLLPPLVRSVWAVGDRYVFQKDEGDRPGGWYAMSMRGGMVQRLTEEGVSVLQTVQTPEGLFGRFYKDHAAQPGICFLSESGGPVEPLVAEGTFPIQGLAVDTVHGAEQPQLYVCADGQFYRWKGEGEGPLFRQIAEGDARKKAERTAPTQFWVAEEGLLYVDGPADAAVVRQIQWDGASKDLTPEGGTVTEFAPLPDGGICFVGTWEQPLHELYAAKEGRLVRLTRRKEGSLDFRPTIK